MRRWPCPGAPPRSDVVGGVTRARNDYSDKSQKEADEAMSRIPPPGRHPKTYSKRITKQGFWSKLYFLARNRCYDEWEQVSARW